MDWEQLSFFDGILKDSPNNNPDKDASEVSKTSLRLLEAFYVSEIPFLDCNYEELYPQLASIIPRDSVCFDSWDLETLIACETVCASICHQINWDYLRYVVFKKTKSENEWVLPENLLNITEDTVKMLLSKYNKPERFRINERTSILRQIGKLAVDAGGFTNLFFDNDGRLLPESLIRSNHFQCAVFVQDPEEKKLQLLLQKLSGYTPLAGLMDFCKPAIDYHLIRCYLRRGLISPKNKLGKEFIFGQNRIERKESTVGALRQLCAELVEKISLYTNLSITEVNQIEWHIGRSICIKGIPDCRLNNHDVGWVKTKFSRCPFYHNCCAAKYNPELLNIEEPVYKGTSY